MSTPPESARTAVVTGASSGIGAATARHLAAEGFHVFCAARREERVSALAEEIGGTPVRCDVTSASDVDALAELVGPRLDVLVNNAGGAFGSAPVTESDPDDWRQMYEVDVIGLLLVTKALVPALVASGAGVILNVGSTAGRIAYKGGGLTGASTAPRWSPRRCGSSSSTSRSGSARSPGMVRPTRCTPAWPSRRAADDIADAITWMVTRPAHVNIDELVIRPRAQAAQHKVHRVND